MSRDFLDDWAADWVAYIKNNVAGDITGDGLQTRVINLKDSVIQDEARLSKSSATPGVVLTGTFASLGSGGIYDTAEGDDGNFLNLDVTSGTITTTATAGFSYAILGLMSLTAPQNEVIEVGVGVDGVQTGFARLITGDGAQPVSGNVRYFLRSCPSSGALTFMARAVDGSATITIEEIELIAVILPTNNP